MIEIDRFYNQYTLVEILLISIECFINHFAIICQLKFDELHYNMKMFNTIVGISNVLQLKFCDVLR